MLSKSQWVSRRRR